MPETAICIPLFTPESMACSEENKVDIVGVTGSIPVTPTILSLKIQAVSQNSTKWPAGSMNLLLAISASDPHQFLRLNQRLVMCHARRAGRTTPSHRPEPQGPRRGGLLTMEPFIAKHGRDRPAIFQGLVVCSKCGNKHLEFRIQPSATPI